MTGDAREEVTRLLAENRRLRELLTEHGTPGNCPTPCGLRIEARASAPTRK
ncbi:hypothetical protein ABXN37_23270 [Piscinibacter sakaiensis]|uniref:hypothetical protein n=1 Tax=Piscinibacter sakaiensis TaxID=1547922 RepID=UPI001E3863BC|nr:hypothetical protein [Piscinibacter sakaiensis]